MTTVVEDTKTRSSAAKLGWGILLVVSIMLALNGVGWFFAGPDSSLSYAEQSSGLSAGQFQTTYPTLANSIQANARQVAIWFTAFGLMALLVTFEGLRHASSWAWKATWFVVAAPLAVGLNELLAGGGAFAFGIIAVGLLALVGQLLARGGVAK